MVLLPVPADEYSRLRLLAHESFHRGQPALAFAPQILQAVTWIRNLAGCGCDWRYEHCLRDYGSTALLPDPRRKTPCCSELPGTI